MSDKPTIRYTTLLGPLILGNRALVELAEPHHTLEDDPYFNPNRIVNTSAIQSLDATPSGLLTGKFETYNTVYVPAGDEMAV